MAEEPGYDVLGLLIGEHGMCAEALDLRLGPVAAPGEAVSRFRQAQVDYLEAFVELAREGREDGVLGPETLLVGKHPGVRLPNVSQAIFVNIVDKALVRWLEHPEQFTQEPVQRIGLVKDHGCVVAREVDRTPSSRARAQIHDPEIAIAVSRDWMPVWESGLELEREIPPREFDLFDRSIETSTRAEQLRDLRWDTTRHLLGEAL